MEHWSIEKEDINAFNHYSNTPKLIEITDKFYSFLFIEPKLNDLAMRLAPVYLKWHATQCSRPIFLKTGISREHISRFSGHRV